MRWVKNQLDLIWGQYYLTPSFYLFIDSNSRDRHFIWYCTWTNVFGFGLLSGRKTWASQIKFRRDPLGSFGEVECVIGKENLRELD